jgi:benzoate transport
MTLQERIAHSPMSPYQIFVIALCFLLNFNDGIDVLLVSFTGAEIMKEWALTNAELGYIFSMGLLGMTLGCFFIAPLGDRVGRRLIFLISLLCISTGMISVYFSDTYTFLLACRFLTGLGIGGILPNLATLAAEFANEKSRDFSVGIVQGGWPLGAILTGFVSGWVLPMYGWRHAYLLAGVFSFGMLVAVYFILPESPEFIVKKRDVRGLKELNRLLVKMRKATVLEMPTIELELGQLSKKDLFNSPFLRSTILYWAAVFFGMITLYTVLSWVPILSKQSGMDFALANYVGTALNLGAFSGVFVMGLLISRFGIKKIIVIYVVLAFVMLNIYGNVPLNFLIMFTLTFFIGFFVQGGFNILFPTGTRIYPSEIRSTGVGLAMGIGRLGAVIGPTLFGWLADSGASISIRFVLFSMPIVLAGILVSQIRAKELS